MEEVISLPVKSATKGFMSNKRVKKKTGEIVCQSVASFLPSSETPLRNTKNQNEAYKNSIWRKRDCM